MEEKMNNKLIFISTVLIGSFLIFIILDISKDLDITIEESRELLNDIQLDLDETREQINGLALQPVEECVEWETYRQYSDETINRMRNLTNEIHQYQEKQYQNDCGFLDESAFCDELDDKISSNLLWIKILELDYSEEQICTKYHQVNLTQTLQETKKCECVESSETSLTFCGLNSFFPDKVVCSRTTCTKQICKVNMTWEEVRR